MATTTTTTPPPQPKINPPPSPPHHDGLHFYQYMLAGSLAGCTEHMAMFPIDTIKTHMQANITGPNGPGLGPKLNGPMIRPIIKPLNIYTSFKKIFLSDGLSGLYRGITAMGLGAGPAHAVYFSVYELCKRKFGREFGDGHLNHAFSGVIATVMSDGVFTPMDMVKQRLQLGGGTYKGVYDCVIRVFKEEGFKGFYASYRTTVVMNAPFTAVHFATYEAAKGGLSGGRGGDGEEEGLVVHATAGAVAGALAGGVTTPLDVVKTQLQCQGVCGCDRFTSASIKDVIKTIVQKDGYRGLMRGWTPRMMFHAPAAAICWSTYEATKSFFHDLNEHSNSSNVT